MLIGEIVKRTGLSKDTIRFYEKQGLIHLSRKDRRNNNYKEYSDQTLARLQHIQHLKHFGFTLNECAEVLEMIEFSEATCRNMSDKIGAKVALLQQKIEEMQQVRDTLIRKWQECDTQCTPCAEGAPCAIVIPEKRHSSVAP